MLKKSLGICLGASTIKVVELSISNNQAVITRSLVRNHECNPRESFLSLISGLDLSSYDYGMVTGRKFRTILDTPSITEPEAVENALAWLRHSGDRRPYRAVASLGAENFIVYVLDSDGAIATVETGNKCASGTGEFFLQQIRRMDISIGEAVSLAAESDLYKVSGRCSVFCKSDCTHALNKGIPIGRVTAGLCSMMAEKILDLLEKTDRSAILAIGGVTHNHAVMQHLENKIKTLEIPGCADTFEAVGAAYYAYRADKPLRLNPSALFIEKKSSFDVLPPIAQGESLVRFETAPQ
jgi:activator of 2-hydroxyglutaryl-CoA dehydratase